MKARRRRAEAEAQPVASPQAGPAEDRREHSRILTVYRVAQLAVDSDSGLCRVANISDTGMMLVTGLDMAVGESVMIGLAEKVALPGEVTWVDGARVGIEFLEKIDAAAVLQSIASASPAEQRPFRLQTNTVGVAMTPHGARAVRILDISQHGMKISHEGGFTPGTQIKVSLPTGLERRGIVRWANDDIAGVQLLEPIAFRDLESARKL